MSYDSQFFDEMRKGTERSARVVVPLVDKWVRPASVVDIGCGEGVWLAQFMACGVQDVLGLDGDYVRAERLAIPPEKFCARNLREDWGVTRRFDLSVCLEVGEHLDATFADELVCRLADLAPVCLFSAAIPHQDGTDHVNEQWPEYWAEKFVRHGFRVVDALRSEIWCNPDVGYIYAQNAILYAKAESKAWPVLRDREHQGPLGALSRVHPRKWLKTVRQPSSTQRAVAGMRRVASRLMPAG